MGFRMIYLAGLAFPLPTELITLDRRVTSLLVITIRAGLPKSDFQL